MIIGIQGSRSFQDYSIFLNGMTRVLNNFNTEDDEFVILSAGPFRVNEMASEFINVSNWKSRGIKAKLVKMPPKAIAERMGSIDDFVYFCLPKEPVSFLVDEAEKFDLIPLVYRF